MIKIAKKKKIDFLTILEDTRDILAYTNSFLSQLVEINKEVEKGLADKSLSDKEKIILCKCAEKKIKSLLSGKKGKYRRYDILCHA